MSVVGFRWWESLEFDPNLVGMVLLLPEILSIVGYRVEGYCWVRSIMTKAWCGWFLLVWLLWLWMLLSCTSYLYQVILSCTSHLYQVTDLSGTSYL